MSTEPKERHGTGSDIQIVMQNFVQGQPEECMYVRDLSVCNCGADMAQEETSRLVQNFVQGKPEECIYVRDLSVRM